MKEYPILFASSNKNKIKEVRDFFAHSKINILIPQSFNSFTELDILENGANFFENALIKANSFWNHYQYPLLVEDSGICIRFLNNEPGIYSARFPLGKNFSHHERNEYILELMKNVKSLEARMASYSIVLIFVINSQEKWAFYANWDGCIAFQQNGSNGFAYDFIFIPSENLNTSQNINYMKTVASMKYSFKLASSHRGKVLKKFENYFLLNEAYVLDKLKTLENLEVIKDF